MSLVSVVLLCMCVFVVNAYSQERIEDKQCTYEGQQYSVGKFPSKDGCNTCTCKSSGKVKCTKKKCCKYDGQQYSVGKFQNNDGCKCQCTRSGKVYCKKCVSRCKYDGQQYSVGKFQNKDGCKCQCTSKGKVYCKKCVSRKCTYGDKSYDIGDKFSDGCKECVCKRNGKVRCKDDKCGCVDKNNTRYKDGDLIPMQDNKPCSHCQCVSGVIKCTEAICPAYYCEHPVYNEGECCPLCACIWEDGNTYLPGESVPSTDPCYNCTCNPGGITRCLGPTCPVLKCNKPTHVEGECCATCPSEKCYGEDGKTYLPGQQMSGDQCNGCTCENGAPLCFATNCAYLFDCEGKEPEIPDGQCCPVCPKAEQCTSNGILYNNGDTFKDKCNTCTCNNGQAVCTEMSCHTTCISEDGNTYLPGESVPSTDPCMKCSCNLGGITRCLGPTCPVLKCNKPTHVEGECCATCPSEKCYGEDGKTYLPGQQMSGDQCNGCTCENGTPLCIATDCYPLNCEGKAPVTPDGQCCPVCPKAEQCTSDGILYNNGDTFKDKCNTCTCINGQNACTKMSCPTTCQGKDGKTYLPGERTSDPCSPCECMDNGELVCMIIDCFEDCIKPVYVPGECCPKCDPACQGKDGKTYSPGESVPSTDHCMTCTCSPDGTTMCSSPTCLIPQCDNPILVKGECCATCASEAGYQEED